MMIALKESDHALVERKDVQELKELASGTNNVFYSMFHKWRMYVHFNVIASLGEQPERRNMNYIIGGYSKFSVQFRYYGNIEATKSHVLPCKHCLKNLRGNPLFFVGII